MYKCEKLLKNARRPEVLVKEIKVSRYIHFVSLFTLLNDRGTQPLINLPFPHQLMKNFNTPTNISLTFWASALNFYSSCLLIFFSNWFEMIYIFTQLLKMKWFQKLKKRISVKKKHLNPKSKHRARDRSVVCNKSNILMPCSWCVQS